MCEIAKALDENEIKQIAEYFAAQPFVRASQAFDAKKAEAGKVVHKRLCEKCHEDGGASPDDDAGILAGQWMPYLEQQMAEYATGKRPMPEKMQVKFDKMDEADIEATIHYYGSLQ